jgi:xylose dehydrogenase (NAD/NADP)
MRTHLNWGLLSTARINRRLIPAIRSAERAELIAVASRSQARAKAYAAERNIPRAFGSYQALLDDPDVDVVYISLPNSLHAEWTIKAIQSNKNVLCEKPLALTVAECDQIITAADATDVAVMEAIMVLYHPLHHKARQLIRDGAVGDVMLARGSFSFFLDRPADVRWDPTLGGGALWDVGSYPVSFIRWIVGEPGHVFGWQALSAGGVDKTFVGLLRYGSGTLGAFDCGFQEPFRSTAEVAGTEGTLFIERPYPIAPESRLLLQRREQSTAEEIAIPKLDAYRCEVDAMTAAVLDGAELAVSLASSLANVATLVALYESARQGQAQPIVDA